MIPPNFLNFAPTRNPVPALQKKTKTKKNPIYKAKKRLKKKQNQTFLTN